VLGDSWCALCMDFFTLHFHSTDIAHRSNPGTAARK
jgi:hypothetical protein